MESRLKKMSELIKRKGSLSIQELIDHFQVSDMTIRRDLTKLEETKLFERFHGGVKYIDDVSLDEKLMKRKDQKQRIADYCVSLIRDHDTVVLDASSTTSVIAETIAESDLQKVTLLTNSLKIAYRVRHADNIDLIMCGGEFKKSSQSFVGSNALKFFDSMYCKYAFISAQGISEEAFTTHSTEAADIKDRVIANSENIYIVADSSKFGKRKLNKFAELEKADYIITDTDIAEDWSTIIERKNIKLIKV